MAEEDAATSARAEMESSRQEVMESEKKIQAIKTALRSLGSASEDESNSLKISAHNVEGLSGAAPAFQIQLSSPIEELVLTKLYDPLDPQADGSIAHFRGVEISMATLTISATDSNNVHLGSSAPHDVAPLCEFDAMSPQTKISKIDVVILKAASSGNTATAIGAKLDSTPTKEVEGFSGAVEEVPPNLPDTDITEKSDSTDAVIVEGADDKEAEGFEHYFDSSATESPKEEEKAELIENAEEKTQDEPDSSEEIDVETKMSETKEQEVKDSETKVPETKEPAETTAEVEDEVTTENTMTEQPICTVTLNVEYEPSKKDLRDKLYDLLNRTSQRKATAIDKLRKSAAAVSRAPAPPSSDNPAIKAGFLNKKEAKKEPRFWSKWYDTVIGPQSFVRQVFPIAQNYILFFGAIALMHFRGQDLALPSPV